MSGTGDTTAPASSYQSSMRGGESCPLPALVIAWSAREPWRVGEVAFLGSGHRLWSLGRGVEDVPAASRLRFAWQRPGATTETGPLVGNTLSRHQLEFELRSAAVHVENRGSAKLLVNGSHCDAALLSDGDSLEL